SLNPRSLCNVGERTPSAVAGSPDPVTGHDRRSPFRAGGVETFGRTRWHGQETVPQRTIATEATMDNEIERGRLPLVWKLGLLGLMAISLLGSGVMIAMTMREATTPVFTSEAGDSVEDGPPPLIEPLDGRYRVLAQFSDNERFGLVCPRLPDPD